jgi:hypothetical protein
MAACSASLQSPLPPPNQSFAGVSLGWRFSRIAHALIRTPASVTSIVSPLNQPTPPLGSGSPPTYRAPTAALILTAAPSPTVAPSLTHVNLTRHLRHTPQ